MSTKADPAAFMTGLPHWKHKGGPLKRAWTARNPCFYMGFYIYIFFFTYIYIYIFLMKWKWSGVIFPNVGFLVPFKVDTMSRLIHIAWAWSVSAVFFCRLIVQLDSKDLLRPWLCQLWMTRLAIFSSFFFTEGHLDWHFSVKCLSHADSPTQLVLVLSTGSFKIEIVRGRLQQKGNRVTYYLRRRHPHSHRKITWNTVITVYWLCSCVSMLFLLVPAISQKISAIPFHTLFYYSPSPCVSSPAFPL